MSRFSSLLAIGALVLAAGCAQDATSPQFRNGADDPIPNDQPAAIRTKVQILLTGSASFPRAKGKATFTVNGDQREFQAQVEEVPGLAGTLVNISLGGVSMGSATVDATGRAGIGLNTRLGDSVPSSVTGQSLEVRAAGGTLIASGSF